jgi:hypothetical protein
MGKSLGFSGEDFANFGTMAGYTGESLQETLGRVSREIVTVSKGFGVNTRVMASNMKVMMKMPGVFGSNTKEMLKTSVAAQKLGMSIEELAAVGNVFDDFESGAQASADLAANFGIVIDASEMMSMSKADQATTLKDAIAASGKSFEDMSRQERQYLADVTKMDMTSLQKMMDPSNAFDSDSMDAVEDGVDAATSATLSQAAATEELSKSMKQLHESMEPMKTSGGFFGSFLDGMAKGFGRSKEFKEMINSVKDAFKVVFDSGKRVGRMFGELLRVGGPLNFLFVHFTNLEDTMRNLMPKIEGHFRQFIDDLMAGGDRAASALPTLIEGIKEALFSGGGGGAFKAMMDGFHMLADLIVANIINMIPFFAKGLIKLFEGAVSLMTGGLPSLSTGIAKDGIMPMTQQAFASLMDSGVISKLGSAFMTMMKTFWEQYGPAITDMAGKALGAIMIAAMVQALPMIIASSLVKGLFGGFAAKLGGAMGGTDAPGGGGGLLQKSFGDKLADTAAGFNDAIYELAAINPGDLVKATLILAGIAVGMALAIMGMVKLAIWVGNSGVDIITLGVVAAVGYGIAKMTEAMAAVALVSSKINPGMMAKAAVGLTAVMAVFAGVAYITVQTMKAFASITVTDSLMPAVEAAGKLTMVVLGATAGIIGLGAILAVIMLAFSNPLTALIMSAAIASSAVIFYGVAKLIKSMVSDFASFPLSKALSASLAATAAGEITETVMFVLASIWKIMKKQDRWNKAVFAEVLDSIGEIVSLIADKLLPTIFEATQLLTEDPEVVAAKLNVIVKLIESFAPITNMMSAAMAIKDIDPSQAAVLLDNITGGLTDVMNSMAGMVSGIVRTMTGLSPAQIRSAAAAAPLIESVAALMAGITPAQELFQDQMYQTGQLFVNREGLNSDESHQVARKGQDMHARTGEFVETMVSLLDQIGGPIKRLAETLATVEIPGDPRRIKTKMEAVTAIMNAMGSAGTAVASLKGDDGDMFQRSDADKLARSFRSIAGIFVDDAISASILTIIDPALVYLQDFGTRWGGSALESVSKGINALEQIPRLMRTVGNLTITEAESFGNVMPAVMTSLEQLPLEWTASAITPLVELITAFNEIDAILANLEPIDIAGTLQQVGDALKVSNETVQIDRGNVHVRVNLNVTMNADDLAAVLVQKEYVKKGARYESNLRVPDTGE